MVVCWISNIPKTKELRLGPLGFMGAARAFRTEAANKTAAFDRLRFIITGPIQLRTTLMQKAAEADDATTPDKKPKSLALCFCFSKEVENSSCQKQKARRETAAPASVSRNTTRDLQPEPVDVLTPSCGATVPQRIRTCCKHPRRETSNRVAAQMKKIIAPL